MAHVPVLDPCPLPHDPLSQSEFAWQLVPPPAAHVPLLELVPLPHELLSQSLFAWQAALLVLQVPVDDPLPLPHVPPRPQSASLWQLAPPEQVPSFPLPPHVPSPQSEFVWQLTPVLHAPPPHVPLPHCALDVHEMGVHVALPHVPLPQSALDEHEQTPLLHLRLPPQSRSRVQAAAWHVPTVAPAHVYEPFGQSDAVRHGSEHRPGDPGFAPLHAAVKPQSVSLRHWFEPPTSALADT
jgi:hypothetical protein